MAAMAARRPSTHSTSVIIAMVMVVDGSWPGQRHREPSHCCEYERIRPESLLEVPR